MSVGAAQLHGNYTWLIGSWAHAPHAPAPSLQPFTDYAVLRPQQFQLQFQQPRPHQALANIPGAQGTHALEQPALRDASPRRRLSCTIGPLARSNNNHHIIGPQQLRTKSSTKAATV